ncbi:MAG: PSD1 domain-containing protein, partial [Planctomycetales bacterium]|nr:PSD1 domain-containing protein [Planctomycetales bacterium]
MTFERDIRPIFRAHCFDCHGASEELEGGLDLRLVRLMKQGGESGPALDDAQPAQSLLLERVRSGEMPPGDARVSQAELDVIARWVAAGAPTARPEPATIGKGLGITAEEREFWSFQPIQRPEIPALSGETAGQARTPIDALILSAMSEGGRFSADADRAKLVRRAYLDLIGLPPSFEETRRWTQSSSEHWYEQLVDELLSSPHYGERWGRHWLDVAGYADSEGYSVADQQRSWAWRYRDWVVKALNEDKPLDRFIAEQLAGDELCGPREGDWTSRQIELLSATGFLRMAADGTGSGANHEEGRNQVVADTVRIVSSSLLGMTVHCAQCHDHRYDPIPQVDYYRLRAVFEPALDPKAWKTPEARRVSLYTEADRQRAAEVESEAQTLSKARAAKLAEYMTAALKMELGKYEEPLRGQLQAAYQAPGNQRSPEQQQLLKQHPSVNITPGNLYQYIPDSKTELKKLDDEIASVRAKKPVEQFVRALVEPNGHLPVTHLFHRGDPQQPKQPVQPGGLQVAAEEGHVPEFSADNSELPTSGRRLELARWLASERNPLFARVMANRIWLHHFGKPLVDTPSDFGRLGARPTHPQLLDYLASELMNGWSLKRLHREIMLSTVYRQEGETTRAVGPAAEYQCKPLVRLDAEMICDAMLASVDGLQWELGGAPVPVTVDFVGQVVVEQQRRRSLYVQSRRSQPVSVMRAFDQPVMETNCERRSVSTVATQSLMLMNSDFIVEQASRLARRARRLAEPMPAAQLTDLPQVPAPFASAWSYGHGRWVAEQSRVDFTALPHWTGSAWQGGDKLPDAQLGFAFLQASGGHPDAPERSVIRRWTAPLAGVVRVSGALSHPSPNGDGVHGLLVHSSKDRAQAVAGAAWTAAHGSVETNVEAVEVQAGDTLDLIVESGSTITSDSFAWRATLELTAG